MEEEIIIPEEEVFDYHKLRYILDKGGYVCHASFGGLIVCDFGECTEYNGEVPDGYETLEEWYDEQIFEKKLNAWKIVDGNLVFDEIKNNELQEQYKRDEIDNSCVTHKELYGMQKEIDDIQDINNSQYTEINASGNIITMDNVKKVYPKIKLTDIDPYSFDKVNLIVTKKNMLPNDAIAQTISGLTITPNEDRSITIDGTPTENIEYNIGGTNTNISPILVFKKDLSYYLSSNNYQIKMYNFDGTNREEVYSGNGGIITFTDEDKPITQIVLYIPKGTKINNVTIYPQLEYGTTGSEYETYQSNSILFDFSEYIEEGIFPSDDLFPSDELFPAGTTIEYIYIENGKLIIKVNEDEIEYEIDKIHLFDGYNIIYTIQDTNIEITYCINNLKLEGTITKNNNFKVLEDGSIEAHNGYFSGAINSESANITGGDITLKGTTAQSKLNLINLSNENQKTNLSAGTIRTYDFNGDLRTSFYTTNGLLSLLGSSEAGTRADLSSVGLGFYEDEEAKTSISASGITTPVVNQTSRAESKKNIEKFEEGLEIIKGTDIYKYNFKNDDDAAKKHIGFVIGEEYNYSSEITAIDKDNKEIGVDTYSMVSVCFNAIKQLNSKIEELENKIKEMEEK